MYEYDFTLYLKDWNLELAQSLLEWRLKYDIKSKGLSRLEHCWEWHLTIEQKYGKWLII